MTSDRVFRGRCVGRESSDETGSATLLVRTERGTERVALADGERVTVGDWIEVIGGHARVLTPNRHADHATSWSEHVLDPRRIHALEIRERSEAAIRAFLRGHGYRETRTPLLVPNPGMDPHIRPFRVSPHAARFPPEAAAFLPTSPELAMKRLLVGGLERIFQITPAFRSEPASRTHRTEFTLLELYRAYADDAALMTEIEELFAEVAAQIHGEPVTEFEGRRISFATPWPRLTIRELFLDRVAIDLGETRETAALAAHCKRLGIPTQAADGWDDLYFRIWLDRIEPTLPADRAVFVCRFPASQAALAVVDEDPDGSRWARRFECFAGGLELGNAFQELTDPAEQRRRFVADMDERRRAHGDEILRNDLDEEFLAALEEGMPPAAGIAIGVDRWVMLLAGERDIDYTFWLPAAGG